MDTIYQTNVHYIRCIKPNNEKQAWEFDNALVIQQLRACGVLETIKMSCAGFPSRWAFEDLVERYYLLVHSKIWSCENAELASRILKTVVDPNQYQVGKTKVFLRAGVVS